MSKTATAAPHLIQRTCLNGWWDFQPLPADPAGVAEAGAIPSRGWHVAALLVPSWWTKPRDAVRAAGETYYHDRKTAADLTANDDNLFDAYGYPVAWAHARSGWVRRTLYVSAPTPGRQRWLHFDAVMPRAWVFVNGVQVAYNNDPTLPFSANVEALLKTGANEIAVRIADYQRDQRGRHLTPTGNMIPCDHSGIWQDVWLEERGTLRITDVIIVTSTRKRTLSVSWTVANDGAAAADTTLTADVVRWAKHGDALAAPALLTFPSTRVRVPAGGTKTVSATRPWHDAAWWSPETPNLHQLRSTIGSNSGGNDGEIQLERFGFREVWIDGPHVMLNDHPMHLFSDWGHKMTPYYQTEGWIRQWFGMMRDANLNHTRLHTHPHPPLVLDLADEEGILVTGEPGTHGSGQALAGDFPEFWANARTHVARFIARDRNRPSVVLWSAGNEMRWNFDQTQLTMAELPKLRLHMVALDPTRRVYHEGDSSLWSEAALGRADDQVIVSRHYGKECSGLGWWDRRQPLSSGEMSTYHYSGPNNTLHLGGDRVFSEFAQVDACAARDTALIIESGRTLGVSCFGPWNLCALQNLRPHPAVTLTYPDWSAPGAKPLRVAANASEFRFWEGGTGYLPGGGFTEQARAFRPLALIDRSQRSGYLAGARFAREVFVVNDTAATVAGEVTIRLSGAGRTLIDHTHHVEVARGHVVSVQLDALIPATTAAGRYVYSVQLAVDGVLKDGWSRELLIVPAEKRALKLPVAVFGNGSSAAALKLLGVKVKRVKTLAAPALRDAKILILERGAVRAVSTQNHEVQAFAARGGRVLVLEQDISLFPNVVLTGKPVSTAFIRAPGHPALAGLTDTDLANWGDDSYAQVIADTLVAQRMYQKDDGSGMLCLCDSGEGGFGHGSLDFSPLFTVTEGKGVIVANQFLLTDKASMQPAALRLLGNLLGWLDTWKPAKNAEIIEAGTIAPATLVAQAKAGATVLVPALNAVGIAAWAKAIGIKLSAQKVPNTYQAVRAADAPLLPALFAGVSQEDTCGIEVWTYGGGEDLQIGDTFLKPVDGLESLWETPTQSALFEMFPNGGRSEPLRSHTRTRFLGAERPARAVVIGRVPLGKGQVLFDQLAVPLAKDGQPKRRLLRAAKRLRANLGVVGASLLDGPTTAGPTQNSPGFPAFVHARGAASVTEVAAMREDTLFNPERLLSKPILNRGAWTKLDGVDGAFSISATGASVGGKAAYLYLVLESPVKRQNLSTNLGVPNPEALTFCDLIGDGTVELTLGGQAYPPVAVTGTGTITDISLEAGYNHLLLKWTGGKTLGLRFRNIMRQPETEFRFP